MKKGQIHKMKKLGIIGGMSWESTQTYYRYLNEGIRARRGGLHSLEVLLYSFDFAEIAALQAKGDWHQATNEMVKAGLSLKAAGADMLLIATNTMHKMADELAAQTQLPLIHIADATAHAIKVKQCQSPLLLATNFTMTQPFYKGHLADKHGISVVTPQDEHREIIHHIIYQELCRGIISATSKQDYLAIIQDYQARGVIDSVILGCTEIGLLISQHDCALPVFDTTAIHCEYALDKVLDESA